MKKLILVIFLISIIASGGNNNSITYLSYVDNNYGFFKVLDITTYKPSPYQFTDRTLPINQGDTVIWINDADNASLTIISDQGLWNKKIGYLKSYRHRFNYTFDKPGKYNFHVEEYPIIRQTIIVNSNNSNPIPTTNTEIRYINSSNVIVTPDKFILPLEQNKKINNKTNKKIKDSNITYNISFEQILSILIAILALFITYRVGKNKII